MTTFTEIVAAVVVHSSTAALGHFGVTLERPCTTERQPVAEVIVARTPRPQVRVVDVPGRQRAQPVVQIRPVTRA